ncbi:MAG: ankyrin repeat domain-containing protein [Elusimicrobia bacterium]|nr:ankyrin repeat domain-containing protein [Elusimicrobiota bacterium]
MRRSSPSCLAILALAAALGGCASTPPRCYEEAFPLMCAISQNDAPLIASLLDHGTQINQQQNGASPLSFAAGMAKPETVKLLIERGADLHAVGDRGATALDMAAQAGRLENADLLLLAGADVRHTAEFSTTALHRAAMRADPAMTERLIQAGALVNARQTGGETALMIAASAGRARVVQALLAAGADLRLKDASGKTAYDHALNQRHPKTAELLKTH